MWTDFIIGQRVGDDRSHPWKLFSFKFGK